MSSMNLNSAHSTKGTALHWAAKHGNVEVIKLIAGSHKVNPNVRSGYTSIHLATLYKHKPIIDLLVRTYAEVTFDPSFSMRSKSRLSKTLNEVLNDNSALAYFIQFMDAKKAKHLVKFWLEAESFRVSALTRLKDQSHTAQTLSEEHRPDRESLHETLSEQVALFGPPLSSGSSGCVSDRSDDVFPVSSQGNICDFSHSDSSKASDSRSIDLCHSKDRTIDTSSKHSSQNSPQKEPSHIQTTALSNFRTVKCTINTNTHKQTHSVSGDNADISLQKKFRPHCQITSLTIAETESDHLKDPNELIKGAQSNIAKTNANEVFDSTSCDVTKSGHSVISVTNNPEHHETEWVEEAVILNLKDNPDHLKGSLIKLETSIEQDANCIYKKYIAQEAQFPIGIDEELRIYVSGNIFRTDGKIDPETFAPVQDFAVSKMDNEYFPAFLRSSFHCKHQIDVLTSGNVFLADVLYNDSALFYFMEFMEQENVHHLVDFLLMADNFQKHLLSQGTYDGIQAQNDAMILYEKFFSLQATNPLGFSDSVRYEVEQNICREKGPLPDCFVKPVMILTQYLEKTYLIQFLNSQLYFKYISECIITIQSGGADFVVHPKYTASDSGSEHSLPISAMNTLLAMDGKQPGTSGKILKNIGDQDLRIDTGQFKPDTLWQRPLAGKLQMAHIDNLGRVITEFEPEPDRRRESRISKAMKKLVNWEEDKNQEDMAWKVAEMIVNDVCSVTMPKSSGNKTEEKGPS